METTQRFVALDVHKQYVMVAAIDAAQQVALSPRKISLEQFGPPVSFLLTQSNVPDN